MLTPEYLDHLPDAILDLYRQVEEDILADMARRISKMGTVTVTADWQRWRLEQIQLTRSDITAQLSKLTGLTRQELSRLFEEAATQAIQADDEIYRTAGLSPGSPNSSQELLQLLNGGMQQTSGTFQNLTRTTANTATQQFERSLDRAWLQVSSGAFDYQTAIRRAVKDLAASGLQAITYPSGHTDTLEVAVRRAVLTGVGKTTGEICLSHAEEMGCDLMEITAHPGARPSHMAWQGKIVSLSGRKGYLSKSDIGYGTGDGFKGWNCRHDWFPYFEGLSESAYPREKLREYENQTVSYNGENLSYYEATQQQRYIERQIRRWKREYRMMDAAGQDTEKASMKLAQWRATERDFCKQTGMPRDRFRSQVEGFGRSEASDAVWKFRKAKSSGMVFVEDIFSDERYLQALEKERVIAYDKNGRIILAKYGDVSSIQFSSKEISRVKGSILTHNHPSNGPLSDTDIYRLWDPGLAEIRAVTKHGIFSAKPPSNWKRVPNQNEMRKKFNEYVQMFKPNVEEVSAKRNLSKEEREYLIQRLVMRRFTRYYGVEMELIPWK